MATKEVFIPQLGQTMEEVTLIQWLVADGARVEQGQSILEVETDKAVFPVEAPGKGFLHIGPYAEGQVVPVLTVVAIIGKEDERFGEAAGQVDKETRRQGDKETSREVDKETRGAVSQGSAAATPGHRVTVSPDHRVTVSPGHPVKLFASPRARRLAAERGVDLGQVTPTGGEGVRVTERDVLGYLSQLPKVTPVAQRMAAEAGVDLAAVAGTGPGGKITRADVAQAVERGSRPSTALRSAQDAEEQGRAVVPSVPSVPIFPPAVDVIDRIPLTGVRGIIAERMGTSVHTTARVTLVMEVDATEFVAMRERLKAKVSEEWGFAPGFSDLLARIVAMSLRKHPYMNARLSPSTSSGQVPDAIERLAHVNLGMAVDTERGLLAPVIRDADCKSLREFGSEFRALVDRARKGRSLPDDLVGGTFTITTLGMYDIDAFTPVINLPEAAILGVGRIALKWVYDPASPAAPVLRQMWTLSLVFDHRLVDGAPAARFLQSIKELIEEPYLLLAA